MVNFTSSVNDDSGQFEQLSQQNKKVNQNVCFKIFSTNGRDISNLGSEEDAGTILFGTGQTFLICARQSKQNGNLTVYMRQVQIGFGQNVVLWTDDNLKNELLQ
jgi:hypothetical protein